MSSGNKKLNAPPPAPEAGALPAGASDAATPGEPLGGTFWNAKDTEDLDGDVRENAMFRSLTRGGRRKAGAGRGM